MVPVDIIKSCKIFKMFPDELIEEIASFGIPLTYKANEMIFNIDEPAQNLAILMKGRVEILTTKRTQFVPVHTVRPGEAFALSTMITGRLVSAAKAAEDSEICALPVEKLHKVLEKDYKVGFFFMKQIAVMVSNRLVKMHYQLDVTGSGYI
jgi:CRP-like cAMP-binding protein